MTQEQFEIERRINQVMLQLITASRADVHFLIDELQELREERAELRGQLATGYINE